MEHLALLNVVSMVALAAVVTVVLIMIGGILGYGIARFDVFVSRWIPTPIRIVGIGILVVGLSAILAQDVVAKGFVGWANSTYGDSNTGSDPGVAQPSNRFVSGGRESLVSWESLGSYGSEASVTGPHLARAWTAVAPADGWTAADTTRLEAHLVAIAPAASG